MEPFLDNPSLVAWGIILLKKSIRRWIHCCHEGMHRIGLLDKSGAMFECHRISEHHCQCAMKTHPSPSPPACNVDTWHDGCMYSCGFLHTRILPSASNSRTQDSSDPMFFQSSSVQCFRSLAHCNRRFLCFLLKEVEICTVVGCHTRSCQGTTSCAFFYGSFSTNVYWSVS